MAIIQQTPMMLDTAPVATSNAVTGLPSQTPVFSLCTRCWGPYLEGKEEEHLKAVQHRHQPMGADSPEG